MRILVVGLGSMGRRRLRNLSHIGGHELAGLEPLDDRRNAVGDETGIVTFADLAAALRWRPEAMVISTPPDHHSEYALAAAEAGVPFFVEASVVLEGVDDVIAAVDRTGTVACPSCTMRFHPAAQRLKARIDAGAIGTPLALTHHVGQFLPDWHPWEDYRSFYVARRATGAAREIVPFELNWLTGLFGEVTDVAAIVSKRSSLEADIDDIYSAVVRFRNGVEGTLMVEVISRPAVRQARIIGEKGTLIWDFAARELREWSAETDVWTSFPDPPPVRGPGGDWVAEDMYIAEMEAFLRAVNEGQVAWPLTLREDRQLLVTLVAMEDASSAGSYAVPAATTP